ncbi:aminomethyl-transferring glycine dehydrogenase subunit GcvPB [Stygiolobus caldivivus]|uniref:glycine dehydrogenase (aminomethyl-transferring) n=1 Tax=Stygiolobus caldivivus TaxID=2824673 RepID=A0A8D5U9K5_9CREN|nr:aminomethyl-transferring glycine dehydrogenase subunit GcvPB [Stygiolobus caldivivus]BCU71241.1 glycine dehydrogenase subunit 2 [Stygiolobus caldivivus]
MWRQAKWDEQLITEYKSTSNRVGVLIPTEKEIRENVEIKLPSKLKRAKQPELPQVSELEVIRHFIRLSQMSFGVDTGFMPLGSCTMKYNPKIEEKVSSLVSDYHPLQDFDTVQGILEMVYEMQSMLAEMTGMDQCSLQVPAGAAGELAGVLMIKKYHEDKNRRNRDEMLVADSAHGTNPASAAMGGYKVVYIRTNKEGLVDLDVLKEVTNEKTAGFMLTNPNTLGLFESEILEISKVLHSVDAKLYYDGANLNGILGVVRPGDMGFDIVHINLHKTFGVPHGGGGPGAGAICAKGEMVEYLPYPLVQKKDGKFTFDYVPSRSIGKIATFYGNIGNVARAYAYILGLGSKGLSMVGKMSTLATNYLISKLKDLRGLSLPFSDRPRKHEVVFSAKPLFNDTGVSANDIAKALIDRGFYAPTIYFPPNVEEALMIEPTETEPKEVLDSYAEAIRQIIDEAYKNPQAILNSPSKTAVSRIDQVIANHPSTVTPTYRVYRLRSEGKISHLK